MKAARVPSLMPCREPWMRLEQRKTPRRSPFSNRRATNRHLALTRRLPPHLKNQVQPLTPSKCLVPKFNLPPPPQTPVYFKPLAMLRVRVPRLRVDAVPKDTIPYRYYHFLFATRKTRCFLFYFWDHRCGLIFGVACCMHL